MEHVTIKRQIEKGGNTKAALKEALRIIEQYQLDIRNAPEIIGLDLIKAGFCQGSFYEDIGNSILRKLKSND